MVADFDNELLLITNADSEGSVALLPLLTKKWKRLRLQCDSELSRRALQAQLPGAEVVQSDFSDMQRAQALLEDVSVCLLSFAPYHPAVNEHGRNMIIAAEEQVRQGGPFEYVLFSSTIYSIIRSVTIHKNLRNIEQALLESSLPFTIVQPSLMMESIPLREIVRKSSPIIWIRGDPATKFSPTALCDLAQATANILADRDRHTYATYQLCGSPEPLNFHEVAEILSAKLDWDVSAEKQPLDATLGLFAMQTAYGLDGLSEKEVLTMQRNFANMVVYFDKQGAPGNSCVLEMLLGRKPLSFAEWVDIQMLNMRPKDKPLVGKLLLERMLLETAQSNGAQPVDTPVEEYPPKASPPDSPAEPVHHPSKPVVKIDSMMEMLHRRNCTFRCHCVGARRQGSLYACGYMYM